MIALQQAVRASTVLAAVLQRAAQSQAMLEAVRPLLPPGLRPQVAAGPLEDGLWCVLVEHSAAHSKLRLLAPTLLAALQQAGYAVTDLRVKVRPPR